MSITIEFELNGAPVRAVVAPGGRLLDVIRDTLHHTGTKEGCGEGECGACTVLVDDRAINSCLYPAAEADGTRILTVEGLATDAGRTASAVQEAFVTHGGAQCGFCSPGMVLTAHALLRSNPDPSDGEIRDALVGNLCRCTGYIQIVDSVRDAGARLRGEA